VGELRRDEIAHGSVWIDLYQDEGERLRRACDSAIRAGVEEYHVRLQHEMAHEVVERMRSVLADLGIDPHDDHVRSVVWSRGRMSCCRTFSLRIIRFGGTPRAGATKVPPVNACRVNCRRSLEMIWAPSDSSMNSLAVTMSSTRS
jgi:hypothetical protein